VKHFTPRRVNPHRAFEILRRKRRFNAAVQIAEL
jgi:hypothetical protein